MERLLIFVKHHLRFLWNLIEWGNGAVFFLLHGRSLVKVLPAVFKEAGASGISFRRLKISDLNALHTLIVSQKAEDLTYFSPHGFEADSLRKQMRKRAFLMMGAFDNEQMVGYFFLRFFANGKCFVGRLIDSEYRGKGIGREMNRIMYQTAWEMGFRCLSTISRNNENIMRAHAKNTSMVVLKELQHDYLLVEFVKKNQ